MNNPTTPKTPGLTRPNCAMPPTSARGANSPGFFVRHDQERAAAVKLRPLVIPRPRGGPSRNNPVANRDNSPDFEIVGERKRDATAMMGGQPEIRKAKKPKSRPNLSIPDAEFVSVYAGPEKLEFRVHRHVITHYSTHFEDYFNSHQSADGEGKAKMLPEVDAEVFGLFSHWNYTQQIEHAATRPSEQAKRPKLMELAKLWTWAGVWNVPKLQNEVMLMLGHLVLHDRQPITRGTPIWQFFRHAYTSTGGDHLKRLAIEKMSRIVSRLVPLSQWTTEFPDGMLVDLTTALVKDVGVLRGDSPRPRVRLPIYFVNEDNAENQE